MYDGRSGSRNTTDRAKAGSYEREQSHSIQFPKVLYRAYLTVLPYAKASIRRSAAAIKDVVGYHFTLGESVYDKIHPSQK